MKQFFAILFTIIALQSGAQNLVYDANAQVRKVDAFKGISVSGGITIYISQGNEQAIAVSADDDKNVDKIITDVKDGILRIYLDAGKWNNWNWGNKKVKAYVTVTQLSSLNLSGGSVGKTTDDISVDAFSLECHGGSIMTGVFKGTTLSIDLSGGSIANFNGTFTNAKIEASGGSILKAYDAITDICDVDASGGSIITIGVNKELTADASGGSIINYRGNGVIKRVDTSGGSLIKKKE